jgi:hypothetical protein
LEEITIASDAFGLYGHKTGTTVGILNGDQIAALNKEFVGKSYHLTVYEEAELSGFPKNPPPGIYIGQGWHEFGCTTSLVVLGQHDVIDWGKTDSTVHQLGEFHLTPGLSVKELFKTVGPPARYSGSGVTYFVYALENGKELRLRFAPQDRDGSGCLVWASIAARKNGRMEQEEILFRVEGTHHGNTEEAGKRVD